MSETITVNGLTFDEGSLGERSYFVTTLAHAIHDVLKENEDDALLLSMQNPSDKEECIRFLHGNDEFDLDAEEELSLAYYLAARNPDEVRRFLDGEA